jgi:DNA repair protein RecN (Recombination protein N)
VLIELRVRELGVIEDVDIVFGTGLTAITGETGAGKTLVVEALELLVGGRADASIVRGGADGTTVEGRFVTGEVETVLSRTVPRAGRSRATIDGRMTPIAALEEAGQDLVDLYGQHAHQSLLRPATQRSALDQFAGVDLKEVHGLRREIAACAAEIAELGGDERQRQRELELLRFEAAEIAAAAIVSADEDEVLAGEEETLRAAVSLREAVTAAYEVLEGGARPGALSDLGGALAALGRHDLLGAYASRLRGLLAELADLATDLRRATEAFEENPARLEEVRARRQLLRNLVRKHGDELADVLAAASRIGARVRSLEETDARRAGIEARRAAFLEALVLAEGRVGAARRAAAPELAATVEEHLHRLGLARARLDVVVPAEGIADDVEFFLAANPGEAALPLAKIASGGELARAMLALRLVLTAMPPTLVFDEVDAGIGGEAALAVGAALAELGADHQVLVVTHLAQIAAHADNHLVVRKLEERSRTIARVQPVTGDDRLVELSRMLSGHPESEVAREHAAELLEKVGAHRSS